MAGETLQVTFACPLCGGTRLHVDDPDNDRSIASREDCGTEFGAWGPIRDKLIADARATGKIGGRVGFKGLNQTWKL